MSAVAILFAALLTQLSELASVVEADSPGPCNAFCVTGTVAYVAGYHENLHHVIVEDENAAVDLYGHAEAPPRTGDVIRIEGCIGPRVASHVSPKFIRFDVLRHAEAPVPVSGTAAEIMGGQHDYRRAYLVGEVRDVVPSGTDPCWNYLSLISGENLYYVPIPTRGARLEQLDPFVGCIVRLDGYPDPRNGSYRFLDERRFVVADLAHMTVLARPPDDPFAKSPSVEAIRHLPIEKISRLGRHRTFGRVLSVWSRRQSLILTPDQRKALVTFDPETDAAALPRRGDCVEVCGYPQTDGFTLRLSHALVRRLPAAPFVEAPIMPIKEADFQKWLPESNHPMSPLQGRRLQLCGIVGNLSDDQRRKGTLPLSIANRFLEVDFSSVPDAVRDVRAGCQIRVTGTCVLASENWAVLSDSALLNGIRLVIDRPDDLEILARPPWWTPRRLAIAVIILLVVLFASLIWNRTLSRLSEKRGRELFRERSANAMAELKTVERTRLAVELHDSISQILTGAAMQLDAGETSAAKRILASCRRELRSCLWELRSNALDAANLADAVRETVAPHLGGRKAAIDIDIPSSALSEEMRHAALRIVREATVNAIRHGRATAVAISGELSGKRLSLTIVDNGRGFDPSTAHGSATGHFGLVGMRERAKAFNGSVSIVSAPGSGTEVTVVLEDRAGYDFGEGPADRDATST